MSGEPNEEERMEELREEKMEQLREQQDGQGDGQQEAKERADAQKKAILRQNCTDEARKRLNTLKMSKPEVGEQVEQQLVAIAKSGRINEKIDDEKMKEVLSELTPDSKSFDIQHR